MFCYVNLRKTHLRENWLISLVIWGETELILGIWGAKAKYFQGAVDFFPGVWGDQCIVLGSKGAQTP